MFRVLYIITLIFLLGGSAVMASDIGDRQCKLSGGAGFVLMSGLKR